MKDFIESLSIGSVSLSFPHLLLGSYLVAGLLIGYKLAKSEMYKGLPGENDTEYKRSEMGFIHRLLYSILIAIYWPVALGSYWVRLLKEKN